MGLSIIFVLAVVLSLGALLRGAWPLAASAWCLFGLGFLAGDSFGPFLMICGAVLLLLGGASMTRGAIYDGSPKAALSERNPSMYIGSEWNMDSVHFTHRFWGP